MKNNKIDKNNNIWRAKRYDMDKVRELLTLDQLVELIFEHHSMNRMDDRNEYCGSDCECYLEIKDLYDALRSKIKEQ